MTHSPHRVVRNRTWLAGILLFLAMVVSPFTTAQAQTENPGVPSDVLCADASSQLAINLCFSDLVDQQTHRIQAHIVSLQSQAHKGILANQMLAQFNAFESTVCAGYSRLFHGSALGTGARLYCQYDLNNAFLDQLRNLEEQARGQHAR